MNESDRKIRREILKYIYDKFEESVLDRAGTEGLYEKLDEVDRNEVNYNLGCRVKAQFWLCNVPIFSYAVRGSGLLLRQEPGPA